MRQIVIALALVTLFAAPAHADNRIGLSLDGHTWAPTLSQPLFDPAVRWVPGDSRTAQFYVRNQAATGAELAVEVRSADSDELIANDDIALEARAAGGDWVSLRNHQASPSLTRRTLAVGDAVKVEVRAVFDAASTNQSMVKSVALRFLVTLSQAGASSPESGSESGAGSGGALPGTGSLVEPWMLWVSAAMIGAGLALVRRCRDEEVADV